MKLKKVYESLIFEGRTKRLSKEKLIHLYNEKVGIEPHKLPSIYRGKKSKMEYGFVKLKEFIRGSAYTLNYYTLIIDNSEYWNNYPDRSKSLVCTTSKTKAADYGSVYHVIPLLDVKIGVTPESDIWDSFSHLESEVEIDDLQHFNHTLRKLGEACIGREISDESWSKFKKDLRQVVNCDSFSQLYQTGEYPPKIDQFITPFKLKIKSLADYFYPNYTSLVEMFEDLLHPDKNKFMTQKFESNISLPENVEVWTDSPALLIQDEYFPEELV